MPTNRDHHPVRIGTCGWTYDDWKGVFYPKGTAAGDYLPFLAQHYPIVEVDSSFYHSPRPSMVQGWCDKTPDQFGFCLYSHALTVISLLRILTHWQTQPMVQ
jgi:uncharacterized protein YecE (DUF72 family)